MAQLEQFRLPDAGEGLTEAEIVTWRVRPGDTVAVNDPIVEIETAKSLVELPCPFAGVVAELLVAEGATVDVGTPIMSVDTSPAEGSPAPPPADPPSPPESGPDGVPDVERAPAEGAVEPGMVGGPAPRVHADGRTPVLVGYGPRTSSATRRPRRAAPPDADVPGADVPGADVPGADVPGAAVPRVHPEATPTAGAVQWPRSETVPSGGAGAPEPIEPEQARPEPTSPSRALAKPPVRRLARDLGIDLDAVPPTGPGGVITRADVERVAMSPTARRPPPYQDHLRSDQAVSPAERSAEAGGWFLHPADETRVPVKGVRKATAAAMVASAFTAPHVTEWVQVDVTRSVKLLDRLRADREFEGVRPSPLLLAARALLLAVRRHPGINASWDEAAHEIVLKHVVNLGIAAATPRGLVVPNVKDAGRLNLRELADALATLTATAREGRSTPADLTGGTITITNVGVFGVDAGTPILVPGEAAILALGQVRRLPWVHRGRIRPREVTTLALSFDHRLVDGELGSRFLADVAGLLEDPSRAFALA